MKLSQNKTPEAQLPWGFNGWAPETNTRGDGWWFSAEDRSFHGLRLTHQPSPWVGRKTTMQHKEVRDDKS